MNRGIENCGMIVGQIRLVGRENAVPRDRNAVKADLSRIVEMAEDQKGTKGYLGQRESMRKFTERRSSSVPGVTEGIAFFSQWTKMKEFSREKVESRCRVGIGRGP